MPDSDDSDKHAREFLTAVQTLLVDALKLSPETHPQIFDRVHQLGYKLGSILDEIDHSSRSRERKRLVEELQKWAGGWR